MSLSPLHQAAKQSPQAIALVVAGEATTYSILSAQVIALGEWLQQQGLKRGDHLGVIAPNSCEVLMLYWACIDLGVLFCPLSPKFPNQQLEHLLQRFNISQIWCPDDSRSPLWQHRRRLQPDDTNISNNSAAEINLDIPANLILTSGSSGEPKAAVHSLSNHIANATGSLQRIGLTTNDSWLLSLPLFHIGGLAIVNRCALSAAAVVMADDQLSLSAQLQRDTISHLSLVATQLHRLLADSPASLSQVKCLLLGGGAIGTALTDTLEQLGIKAFTSYGMTEMGSQITTGAAHIPGSGKLLPNRELCIKNGVIWVKGATLFMGYLQADGHLLRETDADGWFCTKDRGFWDEHGNLHIQGRSDNMFICGGENIQPEEIEAVLKRHPQILDAIVFGESNSEFGLLPSAILKTRDGLLPNQAQLTEYLLSKIARFKRPRVYYAWPQGEFEGLKIQRKKVIEAILNAAPKMDK